MITRVFDIIRKKFFCTTIFFLYFLSLTSWLIPNYLVNASSGPVLISTCQQIQAIGVSEDSLSGDYVLNQDIDCLADTSEGGSLWDGGEGFTPIGDTAHPFLGILDGQNHTISNVYINRPNENNIGLFAAVASGGQVKNLNIANINVVGNRYVGALAGAVAGTITNVSSSGAVKGNYAVGGLVGEHTEEFGDYWSSPFLYTWNGSEYDYVNKLGEPLDYFTDGSRNSIIDDTSLVAKDGKYSMKVAQEYNEITYIDELKLITFDHAPGYQVVTNGDYSDYQQYYTVSDTPSNPLVSCVDMNGADCTEILKDYDDKWTEKTMANYNYWTMDFGDLSSAQSIKLVLRGGWNAMHSQAPSETFHSIEVKNTQGEWQTIFDRSSLDRPARTPALYMVDLTDKFLSDDHQIRFGADMIAFNYFAIDTSVQQPFTMNESYPTLADLSFRGYTVEDDTYFLDHDYYDYSSIPSEMYGNQTGNFTKYGEVGPLLEKTDDQFVVMHHGDQVDIEFPYRAVAEGQERSFILYNDALYKHAKHYWGKTVEPLPFAGMTKYPYETTQESYPMTPENIAYLNAWNTRVVLAENPNQGHSSTIINSSSTAMVTGIGESSTSIGGLVGGNSKDIFNSFATGTVIGDGYVGGLIGTSFNGPHQVSNSYASGNVEGSYNLGGLIGYATEVQVEKSYATGDVTSQGLYAGGLFGYGDQAEVKESFASGDVTGTDYVGGLAGSFSNGVSVNSYAGGTVNGSGNNVGGLIGSIYASALTNTYSSGAVTGSGDDVGGLIGYRYESQDGLSTIISSFWDSEASGKAVSAGGTGKTTEAMQSITTFTDLDTSGLNTVWDFSGSINDDDGTEDIWAISEEINSGYPYFNWQYLPWFENLPGSFSPINLEDGQIITVNPYIIQVYPQDDQGIARVEFYVDDNLICTETKANGEGIFTCAWDTSRYHSTVRVVAHDNNGNSTEDLTRTVSVDLSGTHGGVLPQTGIPIYFYFPLFILIAGLEYLLLRKTGKRLSS